MIPPGRARRASRDGLSPILLAAIIVAVVPPVAAGPPYTASVVEVQVPDVIVIDQDANTVNLNELLDTDRPVMLDFIFGTCTTICPVMSAGFSNYQRKLGAESATSVLVSVSIDPEHDTPEVLKSYLERYRARPGWFFVTGDREDIDLVMRAFDAYVADKMSHQPLTFIKSPEAGKWLRIDGLVSTSDLMAELEKTRKE